MSLFIGISSNILVHTRVPSPVYLLFLQSLLSFVCRRRRIGVYQSITIHLCATRFNVFSALFGLDKVFTMEFQVAGCVVAEIRLCIYTKEKIFLCMDFSLFVINILHYLISVSKHFLLQVATLVGN